ncbi:MAG: AAA+ family ATPase, partial [Acidimicrobiia bacterium]|nr:AAA+ family ATPase [Acidimicrobiia bacterium]
MALSNHERVGQALTLLRDGISSGAERAWREVYGPTWMQQVNNLLYQPDHSPSADDLSFLLKGVQATWKPIFGKVLPFQTRNYVSLLRDARNKWAHNRKFGSDETVRILDHCEVVLKDFKAPEQAEEVRTLKKALQRQVYEQEGRDERKRLITIPDPAKGQPDSSYPPWR